MKEKKKIFVLDTSVILYDHTSYRNFQEHDVVIPISVLEELDTFKKGNDTLNFEAREFIRIIDKISTTQSLTEWNSIGPGLGNIIVSYEHTSKIDAIEIFDENKVDHKILNVALHFKDKNAKRNVVLVTKDINLRVKAKSLGLNSEDYLTGIIKNTSDLYTGKYTLNNVDMELIDKLYVEKKVHIAEFINCDGFPMSENYNNGYFIIKGEKSALAYYNPKDKHLHSIDKQNVMNIRPRNAEQTFAIDAILNKDIKIVSLCGKAGTGKTLLAMAAAIAQKKEYYQIFVARPAVPLIGKDLGFLPGSIDDKISVYLEPIWDNLKFIKQQNERTKDAKKLDDLTENEKIVVTSLAYIRGRSLSNILFIVDEAQNLTPIEIKTIITRLGENSKIIFTGDIYQIDTPYLDEHSNGLAYIIDRLKGEELYAHVTLEKGERSEVATMAANKL